MTANEYLAGALDGSVDTDETCTLLANENVDLSKQLEAATRRADAAERKLDEVVGLLLPYAESASTRMYDGTNGNGIRQEALRRIAQVKALLSASAEPASTWIKCSDRLPDEHKADYLCLFEDGRQQVSEWLHDDTEGWCFWYGDPTHWMPLPDAPAKGGDGEADHA